MPSVVLGSLNNTHTLTHSHEHAMGLSRVDTGAGAGAGTRAGARAGVRAGAEVDVELLSFVGDMCMDIVVWAYNMQRVEANVKRIVREVA